MQDSDYRVLVMTGAGTRLYTVKQFRDLIKALFKWNPEFRIESDRCGISVEYDKDDPHTESDDIGRRRWTPHKIGSRWRHEFFPESQIIVFNPMIDIDLAKALGAVTLTMRDSLKAILLGH